MIYHIWTRCHFSVIVNFWGSSLYVMCYVSDGKSCSGQLKIKGTHCKYKYSIKCIHRNLHNAKPACQPLPLLQLLTKSIIPYDTLWVWGQELYGHWKVWIFGGERIPLELLLLLHTIAMCTGLQSTHCFLLWATTLHHYWVVLKPKYSCPSMTHLHMSLKM